MKERERMAICRTALRVSNCFITEMLQASCGFSRIFIGKVLEKWSKMV